MTGKDTVVIEGVGKDAEVEVNETGGLQSKSPAFLHLIDPDFLAQSLSQEYVRNMEEHYIDGRDTIRVKNNCIDAVIAITDYEKTTNVLFLYKALGILEEQTITRLFKIGSVLQYGATKGNGGKGYPINNWRKINRESHINHALVHLLSCIAGDTQDDHIEHALCRLQMAISTKETEGFHYTKEFGTKV